MTARASRTYAPRRGRAAARADRPPRRPPAATASRSGADDPTWERLAELADDVRVLARVRLELLWEQARDAATWARRTVWLGVIGVTATAMAVVLLVRGVAGGVGALLGSAPPWVADLATGAVVIGAVVATHLTRHAWHQRRRARSLRRDLAPRRPRTRAPQDAPQGTPEGAAS